VRLREIYDFDGILVSLHGHDPGWKSHIRIRRTVETGEEIVWNNGENTTLYLSDELPRHIPLERTLKPSLQEFREHELPGTLDYIPVSQGLHFRIHPEHTFDIFHTVRRQVGEEYSIHGEVTSPFDYFIDLFGVQESLISLIDHPDKSKLMLIHFTKLIRQLAREMCDAGIDAIKISSPFAGSGFISPSFYREFVLPFEREIALAIRAKHVHAYTHTCGAIADRLELMFDAGVSGIECLDPPPLGNVELEEAKGRTHGRGFIKGNVDSVNLLLSGTQEEILADAKRRIEIGKQGGGFIFSTACSVAPHVRRDRLLLLREAVDRWG
jgi:uroporphyrinogen-III decarboxylase